MIDFFSHDFILRACIAGSIIAILAPLLGCFIVLRRASMLSDTLAHISLLGVGIGIMLQYSPQIIAIGVASIAAILIEVIVRKSKIGIESIQALFLSGGLAVALALVHIAKTQVVDFESFLFGNILTVSENDIAGLFVLLTLGGFIMTAFWWKFFTYSLDEPFGESLGLRGSVIRIVLAVLVAVTISLSLQMIGGLLMSALIVVPVLAALQWTKSFRGTAFLSIFFGLLAVWGGLLGSYFWDVPSGSAIVISAIIIFLGSFLQKVFRGF